MAYQITFAGVLPNEPTPPIAAYSLDAREPVMGSSADCWTAFIA